MLGNSLDAENRDLVPELPTGMHEDGKAVVIVTHDEHVAGLCKRRVRLDKGRLVIDDMSADCVAPRGAAV